MDKRISLLLFAFFATLGQYNSQSFEWSNLQRYRNAAAYNRWIGQNDDGYYVLRSRYPEISGKIIIERYRQNMGLDYSKKLPGLKGSNFISCQVRPHYLQLWKTQYNPNNGKVEVKVQLLDNEAEPISEPTVVATTHPKAFGYKAEFYVQSDLHKLFSALVYTEAVQKQKTALVIQVMDTSLTIKQSARFTLPFDDEQFEIRQILLDTNGHCFILINGIDKQFEKNSPEYVGSYLYSLSPDRDSVGQFYLNFEDTYLHHPIMSIDRLNHRLQVSGYYSLKSISQSKGLLDFVLELPNDKIIRHEFIPFTIDFAAELIGEKGAQAGNEPENLVVRNLIMRSDGGYLLIGEEFYVTQQSYTYYINGMPQVSSRNVYNFGKILVFSVSPFGHLESNQSIQKIQSSGNDFGHYSSFAVHKKSDQLLIIYNDKLRSPGDVMLYQIQANGKINVKPMFRNQNSYVTLVPLEAKQIDGNTLLIPSSKDRKFAFLKITF